MLVSVALVGVEFIWRFGESLRLDEWIEQCAWTTRGGFFAAHTSGPVEAELLGTALRERLLRLDASRGRGDLVVSTCSADACLSGLDQLRTWLDLGPADGEADALRWTADAFADAARVFVVTRGVDGEPRDRWTTSLRQSIEEMNKVNRRATPVVIDLCAAGSGSDVDLRRGVPLDLIGRFGEPLATWDAYVHHRLAWECAGDVDLAADWQERLGNVRAGNDDAMERFLDDAAVASLARTDPHRSTSTWAAKKPPGSVGLPGWSAASELAEFVWCPRGVAEPVPWVARALLKAETSSLPARSALRSALVCAPLRDAVIGRCVAWEAALRTAGGGCSPPDQPTQDTWNAYERGTSELRLHYPRECVASPSTPWDVASFGAFIRAHNPARRERDVMHAVRVLRNAMVHGHYVSWATLRCCDEIARSMQVSR